ncbi:MAG: PTS glucose transporter subunit IIA [bacterium]|nr:PTS glucose transporter subunit IIA [bacterium]MCM1374354.1 PTS glucose transporter subunit IIA [Muribaculum sp.]
MGITLNVWVFSGIIGTAYIMGYLMSRTMGRVLAAEGVGTEPPDEREAEPQGQRAPWPERTEQLRKAETAEAERQESLVRSGGIPREAAGEKTLGETREWQHNSVRRRNYGRHHREQQVKPSGHPFASPVAGQVDVLNNQGRRGVLFTPEENRVYAPASGKIIRLYPRGNEFLLRTDSGVVLRVRAGERDAEMTRDYFRPRVVQNEFVGKGKLLLEYDREALARDGYDTHVSMTVEEDGGNYNLSVTGRVWVKNGQDCLWVL